MTELRTELPWLLDGAAPAAGEDVLLGDPEQAWIVEEGVVELFFVDTSEAGAPRRPPMVSARAGSLFTAFKPANGYALLARAHNGTRLQPVDLGELRPEPAVDIVPALEAWLAGLLIALRARRAMSVPQPFHRRLRRRRAVFSMRVLKLGRSIALPEGEIARVDAEFAWIEVERGRVRVLGGRERARSLEGGQLAPIGGAHWLLAESPVVVRGLSSLDVIASGRLSPALAAFGDEVRDVVAKRIEREREREQRRLAGREQDDALTLENAMRDLASTLDERRGEREQHQIDEREQREQLVLESAMRDLASTLNERVGRLGNLEDGPAFVAMRTLGRHLGVTILGPRRSASSGPRIDIVSAIARASHLRTRSVHLVGRWWRRDIGPLVGFLGDEKVPVALLPGRRGYVMHDPDDGEPIRVRARLAGQIGPDAHELYRPLPERALDRGKLVRFGLHGSRRDIALLLACAVGVAALGLLVPVMTGVILGRLVPRAERAQIGALGTLLLLSASVSALLNTVFSLCALRLEGRLDLAFQAGVWDRLMALPARFFRDYSTGELATATLAISQAREVLAGLGFKALLAIVVTLANFVLICAYDLRLALLTVGVVAIGLTCSVLAGRRVLKHQRDAYRATQGINSRTFQLVRGVAKVSTAAAEARAFAHWASAFTIGRRHTYAARSVANRLSSFNAAFTLLAAAAAFWAVTDLFPGISEPTFLVFNIAFFQVIANLLQVSGTAMLALGVVPALGAIAPIMTAIPEAVRGQADPGPLSGALEVRGVSFCYHEEEALALDQLSFSVEPGEMLAIVGPSGCGKSTLLRLLLAFDTPQEGSVRYDGRDLTEVDPIAVRSQFGVVLQDSTLFSGDILSNIIGSGLYTYDDAWEALRMCGLDEEVAAMPMGVYTMLGDGGGTLSGGQRQRLLLARALVAHPRYLLLDEATSALDNRSQAIVTESMDRLSATRVVIAHRLSTIRGADRIIVLDRGRLVQQGNYEELMGQEGLFRALTARQIA